MARPKKTEAKEEVEKKPGLPGPWDYLKAIGQRQHMLIAEPNLEKSYPDFIIRRALSMSESTALVANEANLLSSLPKRLQHDFLFHIFPKGYIRTEWIKADKEEYLEVVKEFFGYSERVSRMALRVLTTEQLEEMKEVLTRGTDRKF